LVLCSDSFFEGKDVIFGDEVTKIGNSAFFNCRELETVEIPERITSIGDYAFSECYSLKSIKVHDGITYIGKFAFNSCKLLPSFQIPRGITTISNGTFRDCESFESVIIPDNITSIGDTAYFDCKELKTIIIGKNVQKIGKFAFAKNTRATTFEVVPYTYIVSYINDPFVVHESAFSYTEWGMNDDYQMEWGCTFMENVPLYVPIGTKSKYKSTDAWNRFKNIFEFDTSKPFDPSTVGISPTRYNEKKANSIYDLMGRKLDAPQKGLNIIGGKKYVIK
jgi:hypothetical protein